MQEERSGSGAESLYKSSWPYFLMLDFLRSQFKTRPTSGNIKKKCENLEEQTTDTNFEEANLEENTNDISLDYPSELQITEGGNDVGNVSTSASVRPSSVNEKTMNEGLVHQNNFNKRRAQNPDLKKLIQIEEKKMALFEEKRARREEKPNDDMLFFESLLPHMKNINGADKLLFRNEVTNLVLKYAYSHDSSRPSTVTSNYSTRQSFVPSDHSLQNSTSPTPQQDNSLLDLDQWNQSFNPSFTQGQ